MNVYFHSCTRSWVLIKEVRYANVNNSCSIVLSEAVLHILCPGPTENKHWTMTVVFSGQYNCITNGLKLFSMAHKEGSKFLSRVLVLRDALVN